MEQIRKNFSLISVVTPELAGERDRKVLFNFVLAS